MEVRESQQPEEAVEAVPSSGHLREDKRQSQWREFRAGLGVPWVQGRRLAAPGSFFIRRAGAANLRRTEDKKSPPENQAGALKTIGATGTRGLPRCGLARIGRTLTQVHRLSADKRREKDAESMKYAG